MLGRKQSVRNNEDWKNALDHIEETVSKKELDSLVKKTVKDIKEKSWQDCQMNVQLLPPILHCAIRLEDADVQ